jgi:hypothetical protein
MAVVRLEAYIDFVLVAAERRFADAAAYAFVERPCLMLITNKN